MTEDSLDVEPVAEVEHEIGHEVDADPVQRRAVRYRAALGLAGLPRSLGLALVFTAVTRLAVYLRFMRYVELSGDERFYWRTSKSIIDLVGFGETSRGDALDEIIGRGWFMPGISALLTPVRLFSDDIAMGRLWMGLLNLVMFVVVVHILARHFGIRAAWCFWAIGTFMPTIVLFSFSLWGDITGSFMVVLLTFAAVAEARKGFAWRSSWRWVAIGFGLGVLTYVRPSMLIVSGVLVAAIVLVNADRDWRAMWSATWRPTLVMALTSILMIAPWSALLSSDKGGPYLTTTSIELGQIVGFGDPEDVAEVVGDANQWTAWDDFIQETARREDISYAEAMSRERSRILSSVSTSEYVQRIGTNFDSMLLHPTGFINRFYRNYNGPTDGDVIEPIGTRGMVGTVQVVFWIALLGLMFADFLIPRRITTAAVWEHTVLQLTLLSLLVQPFIHAAHPRHHMAMLVVLAVIASVRLFGDGSRWPLPQPAGGVADSVDHAVVAGTRRLFVAEVGIAVIVALTGLVILVV